MYMLEFNSVVWSPTLIKDTDLIEQVQRRFTKRFRGFKDITYPNRLQRLKLLSLELRRLHLSLDLIYCYKIMFGLVCVNFDDLFKFSTITHTRGHCYKLYKSRCTSVVVVGSKGIREVNWSFAISSEEQRYLADVIITH